MAKNKSECIDTARKALNLFTGDELEEYIKKVSSETIRLRKEGVPFPREAAIKNMNNELLAAQLEDSSRSARDIAKWDDNKNGMDKGYKPKSFVDKTAKNTDKNIETANHANKQLLSNDGFDGMSKEELNVLVDGKSDDSILAVADGDEHGDSRIKKLGDALREYFIKRNTRLIQSDAMRPSEMHRDRGLRNSYDRSKMRKIGKENWVVLKKSLTDIEETFRNTRAMNIDGEIDDAIVNEMIGNTFDNIMAGYGPLFTKTTTSRDMDVIERSRHMFYIYKDYKSWGIGNKQYGQGSLLKSWLMDIDTASKQIGMAQIMGTQPQKMWNQMRHYQVEKSPPTLAEKAEMSLTEDVFANLLGIYKGASDPRVANFFEGARNLGRMARSAKIAMRSIPDIANVGGIAMRSGNGYWGPMLHAIVHLFDAIPSKDRKFIAKQMNSIVSTQMGQISRHIEVSGMGNALSKVSNNFFHIVGLEALDKSNKISAMMPIMTGFGRASKLTFNKLHRQQQAYLKRFNISEIEWDSLREKTKERRFSMDNIDNMTDDEVKELWGKTDKVIPLSEYRGSLYRKVFAMFDTAHEFAVLQPTAYSKLFTTWNRSSGDIRGELIRNVMEFKGYAFQWMRRIVVGGMQDFDSYQGKFMYALNMALGTIMLTQLSEALIAISSGLTPPDPRNMSKGEATKYTLKMLTGGAGVFNTILNNPRNLQDVFGQMLATPSNRLMGDPIITAFALGNGDLKAAKRHVKNWINVANPIATAPILSPFVDKILGNKPYLEPGQHSLF